MFLKPIKIRSQNQLKTSDKKRLIEELNKHFPALENYSLFTMKENVLLLKIETGAKLLIPVYVVNDEPFLFIYNQILIPTLHMLYKCPQAILIFKTFGEVVKKLIGGADLMLPGVVDPTPSNLPIFSKDTPACVTLNTGMIPVAVGVTACSSKDMTVLMKGKCIHILHVIGDKLYNLKNTSSNMLSPLSHLVLLMQKLDTSEKDVLKESHSNSMDPLEQNTTTTSGSSDLYDSNSPCAPDECSENATEEMDKLLMYTLCVAIKYSKGLHVPILTSNFFKVNMVPACPKEKLLDMKKSSYKKCGQFMQQMMDMGILKVEEQKKGIEYITEFNYEHAFISEFYLDPSLRPKVDNQLENSVKPLITEAHSVTATMLPIFSEFGYKKGSVIDNSEIRKLVSQYIKNHNLQDQSNKGFIILNDILRRVLLKPHCSIEDAIKHIYNVMSPCFKIVCGNTEIIHKGKLEPINITVAKRAGSKKVTVVDNVETYGISITELSNICQHGVAASTTIVHSENPRKGSQLLIQGNQVLFVYNLLTEKCMIPKRYVKGLEFAPKKQH